MSAQSSRDTPRRSPTSARKEQERQHERDEQETDAIDLRLNDEEDPVERVEREPDGQHRRDETGPSSRYSAG